MKQTIHIVTSINGMREHFKSIKNKTKMKLTCWEMFGCSYEDFLIECTELEAKGYTVIPSASCDNIGPDGRCLGHQVDNI